MNMADNNQSSNRKYSPLPITGKLGIWDIHPMFFHDCNDREEKMYRSNIWREGFLFSKEVKKFDRKKQRERSVFNPVFISESDGERLLFEHLPKLSLEERILYETIPGIVPQTLHFDFDGKASVIKDFCDKEDLPFEDSMVRAFTYQIVQKTIARVEVFLKELVPLFHFDPARHVSLTDSSIEGVKGSFHLVIAQIYLQNNQVAEHVFKQILDDNVILPLARKQNYDEKKLNKIRYNSLANIINDGTANSSFKQWRLLNCHKIGKDNVKKFMERWTDLWGRKIEHHSLGIKDEEARKLQQFRDTLIGYRPWMREKKEYLLVDLPIPEEKTQPALPFRSSIDDLKLPDWIRKQFSLHPKSDKIELKRIAPGSCPLCTPIKIKMGIPEDEAIHENNNAFLEERCDGKIVYKCYQFLLDYRKRPEAKGEPWEHIICEEKFDEYSEKECPQKNESFLEELWDRLPDFPMMQRDHNNSILRLIKLSRLESGECYACGSEIRHNPGEIAKIVIKGENIIYSCHVGPGEKFIGTVEEIMKRERRLGDVASGLNEQQLDDGKIIQSADESASSSPKSDFEVIDYYEFIRRAKEEDEIKKLPKDKQFAKIKTNWGEYKDKRDAFIKQQKQSGRRKQKESEERDEIRKIEEWRIEQEEEKRRRHSKIITEIEKIKRELLVKNHRMVFPPDEKDVKRVLQRFPEEDVFPRFIDLAEELRFHSVKDPELHKQMLKVFADMCQAGLYQTKSQYRILDNVERAVYSDRHSNLADLFGYVLKGEVLIAQHPEDGEGVRIYQYQNKRKAWLEIQPSDLGAQMPRYLDDLFDDFQKKHPPDEKLDKLIKAVHRRIGETDHQAKVVKQLMSSSILRDDDLFQKIKLKPGRLFARNENKEEITLEWILDEGKTLSDKKKRKFNYSLIVRPREKEDYATRDTIIPTIYRPNAKGRHLSIREALKEMFLGDESMYKELIKALGVTFWSRSRVKHFFQMVDEPFDKGGDGGKSVLFFICPEVFGPKLVISGATEIFVFTKKGHAGHHTAHLMNLRDALMCYCSEPHANSFGKTPEANCAEIKKISGGDFMGVRGCGGVQGQMKAGCTLWAGMNKWLAYPLSDKAYENRCRYLPVPAQFVELPDPRLPYQRRAITEFKEIFPYDEDAKSEFLNLTLEGYRLFLEEGLIETRSMKRVKQEIKGNINPFQDFIETCIIRTNNNEDYIYQHDLRAVYEAFCWENGEEPIKYLFDDKITNKGLLPKTDQIKRTIAGKQSNKRGKKGIKFSEDGQRLLKTSEGDDESSGDRSRKFGEQKLEDESF
jgi:hypothetical protein